MARLKAVTALATLAVVFCSSGTALADPFADSVVDLQRVDEGFSQFNTTLTPDLTTSGDDGDDGRDALGVPDFLAGVVSTSTTLGFDQNGTTDTADDTGGQIILAFDDNVCMNGSGMDIMIWDVGSNESALVDVSNDGGKTYVEVGEVSPGAGYKLDLEGIVDHFGWIRITATDYRTNTAFAGMELDAVTCLNSIDNNQLIARIDDCDVMKGNPGMDVRDFTVDSDGTTVYVDMELCGPAETTDRAEYKVHFDYADLVDLDGDGVLHDGPDSLDPNPRCKTTADTTAHFKNGAENRGSPGIFLIGDNRLSLEIGYAELNAEGLGVIAGDRVLVSIETQQGRAGDTAPTTESKDGCGKPQMAKEVREITLKGP